MTFNYVLNKIKNPDDIKDIKASYEYANSKLSGIMRKNGDTEISHCLEVANILIDLNVDKETIICAILHSVLDFNDIDEKEIVEKFSLETYKIIFSLSKINNLEMVDDSESAALYLRKVMVGLSEDVRVLFIKLADRLHNMRTFDAISTSRQKKVANETLSVLVPIAHRLGINSIKSELENLSLYYLKPDVYNDILEKLNATVDSLNNYYYPNWSHSMSCTLTPLQSLQRYVNNLKNLSMTFVQSYILGKHYGGIAFFGNTGAGYVEYSDKFQDQKENQNQNTLSEAGKIGALTKQSYNGGSEHDLKTRHTLIGDPMINLWIHNPSKISGKSGRPSPELVPDSITNLFIASYNIKDNTVTRSTVAPFMLEMLRCPDNTIATVFGNNVLPAIMPLNIRNITFTGSKTITANNIQIGSDVIFSNGSNVEIYALGDITIGISNGNEPRFLNNSRVTIHTPGNVKISDVRIAPGAVLDIHAGNLELGPNFTLPLGAELHYEKSVYN